MKFTWLGQAGILLEGNKTIMIDPYLSDSVKKVNPQNYRRVPIDERIFDITPDIMVFTHDHLDHYDPETAPRFVEKTDKKMTVLSPTSVWQKARLYGNEHNYVQFNRGTEWTEDNLRFSAICAVHSDPYAIGVLIEDLETDKNYYVTGDTLYNRKIFDDLPSHIDTVFLPVNGVGNNMNMTDAARFANKINASAAVPIHFGMFDELSPDGMAVKNCIVPKLYEEILL